MCLLDWLSFCLQTPSVTRLALDKPEDYSFHSMFFIFKFLLDQGIESSNANGIITSIAELALELAALNSLLQRRSPLFRHTYTTALIPIFDLFLLCLKYDTSVAVMADRMNHYSESRLRHLVRCLNRHVGLFVREGNKTADSTPLDALPRLVGNVDRLSSAHAGFRRALVEENFLVTVFGLITEFLPSSTLNGVGSPAAKIVSTLLSSRPLTAHEIRHLLPDLLVGHGLLSYVALGLLHHRSTNTQPLSWGSGHGNPLATLYSCCFDRKMSRYMRSALFSIPKNTLAALDYNPDIEAREGWINFVNYNTTCSKAYNMPPLSDGIGLCDNLQVCILPMMVAFAC
jgi:hypothetical protein